MINNSSFIVKRFLYAAFIGSASIPLALLNSVAFSQGNDVPRFDFKRNSQILNKRKDDYIDSILFKSTKEELRRYQKVMIKGDDHWHPDLFWNSASAHVSVLFNITGDTPADFDERSHKTSIAAGKLSTIVQQLDDRDRKRLRLEVISAPIFFTDSSSNQHYEHLDLFIDHELLDPILGHPDFIDITLAGTTSGYRFYGSQVRFSLPDTTTIYTANVLREGYFREIREGLSRNKNVKVHVLLNEAPAINQHMISEGEPLSSQVLKQLKAADYSLIKKSANELLIFANTKSAQILYRDPRVAMMKDYEYHHDLELARGRWQPHPLSDVKKASDNEAFQVQFESRTDIFDQPTVIIESQDQLSQFFNIVGPLNRRSDYKTALRNANIDFSNNNLVLYSQTEPSGSISLEPRPPMWVDGELIVAIDRYSPNSHTADMAQHFFAYIIGKDISKLSFRAAKREYIFSNQATGLNETRALARRRK